MEKQENVYAAINKMMTYFAISTIMLTIRQINSYVIPRHGFIADTTCGSTMHNPVVRQLLCHSAVKMPPRILALELSARVKDFGRLRAVFDRKLEPDPFWGYFTEFFLQII